MIEELNKIMFVDDDEDIRELANVALSSVGGFLVTLCPSGEEALKQVTETHPQLIILDVLMPGTDGPATLKKLQENPETAQIPVFFITARAQPTELAYYKKIGALDVITKPFDPMELSATILGMWQKIQLPPKKTTP